MRTVPRPPRQRQLTLRERLLGKTVIDFETGCWNWTGSKERNGYGKTRVDGRHAVAHRAVFELIEGSIPEGLTLDHACRNRGCVNPAHLEPVTHQENCRRAQAAHTHCVNGHPFEPSNAYWTGNKRRCRTCTNASNRRSYAKTTSTGPEVAA